jgi:hypothetical protein
MILRLLLITIAFVILLRLLGWRPPFGRGAQTEANPKVGASSPLAGDQKVDADLVMCSQCGLSVSRLSAYSHGGQWACCIEHLQA